MNNKFFEITWVDGSTSICEGKDIFNAINNHWGKFYQQFYLKHKEITHAYTII